MSAHKLQWSLIKKVLGREVNGYLNVPGFSHSDECTWVFILPIAFLTFPISFWASFENVGEMDSTCPQRTINSWNKLLGNQTYSSIIKANALKSVKPFFFLPMSHPIESWQIVFFNQSWKETGNGCLVKSSKSWLKKLSRKHKSRSQINIYTQFLHRNTVKKPVSV